MATYFAPASAGNFSVGFDLLGAAFAPIDGSLLGDKLEICGEQAVTQLRITGRYRHQLPEDSSDNLVLRCYQLFQQRIGRSLPGLALHLHKELPVGSGLGSSACSIVVACYAFNHYFNQPLSPQALLQLMAEAEGGVSGSVHYDNVAPSYLGGLQLMLPESKTLCRSLPWFEHWRVVLSYPGTVLSTKAARAAIPAQLELATSIQFAAGLSRFVSALYCQDEADALAALQDVIAEPARALLMPELPSIRQALTELGVAHVGISGAGPTVFALCQTDAQAEDAARYLAMNYAKNQDAMTHICRLSPNGAQVLKDETHAVS
ncbi:homoserine kinase [Alkalimonas collagenimarina]|uniref:Homoserine kinase n=1 Tax=Alkalimonas collagenimarina TaxID=400390 RepID=A0ABT9H214_9GAMM|nr:homoserine kinase [Alkalimonas collagenimarina]MDP4537263.1 homoserine kinase [Alkalimonas collagenimarina]